MLRLIPIFVLLASSSSNAEGERAARAVVLRATALAESAPEAFRYELRLTRFQTADPADYVTSADVEDLVDWEVRPQDAPDTPRWTWALGAMGGVSLLGSAATLGLAMTLRTEAERGLNQGSMAQAEADERIAQSKQLTSVSVVAATLGVIAVVVASTAASEDRVPVRRSRLGIGPGELRWTF